MHLILCDDDNVFLDKLETRIRGLCQKPGIAVEMERYDSSKKMLEGLKDLGMKLGVISNTASLYQVFDILKEYGIRDYFQDVTLSSVTGYRKPNPNIFMVSHHQVQSDPAHCAYVGDTISRDVIGPIRMGFGATFHIDSYLTRLKDTHISPDVKATYNIQDIYEVYTILKESH